jgi:plasmid stabilization system protein ParE
VAGYYLVQDAETDLNSILDYIAEDSVPSAIKVQERFLEIFRLLADNPDAGHFREDLTLRPVRFFPVYSYMVVYLTDTNPVEIVRILGVAQDAESILN